MDPATSSQEQEPAQLASQPGDHAQALAASIHGTLEGLESGFQQLCTSLQERVQAAQQQTLDHLLLYESAVDELQASAADASGAGHTLLSTCRQLAEELRGVDLLAGRVAAVRALVEQLEAQVSAVVVSAGRGEARQGQWQGQRQGSRQS